MLGLCKFPAIKTANRTIFLWFLLASDWNNIAVRMMQWPNAWVDLRFAFEPENALSTCAVNLHENRRFD